MRERRSNVLSESSATKPQSEVSVPKLLFESGSPGRSGFYWPAEHEKGQTMIPEAFLREDIPGFPELGELEVLRHFTRLSHRNFAIESQFYPLGSCTMKYNPKVNEVVARLPGLAQIHPLAPVEILQGAMELLYNLERILVEISGMDCISLQPSAGAQGELTGLMLIRACLTEKRKSPEEDNRTGHSPRDEPRKLDSVWLRRRSNLVYGAGSNRYGDGCQSDGRGCRRHNDYQS